MVVSRRQNIVGNVEDLEQTKPSNGHILTQDSRNENRKLDARKASTVVKRYINFVSYSVECLVSFIAIFYFVLILSPVIVVYNVLKYIEKQWVHFTTGGVSMSGQDALWLQDSKENRLIINSATVVDCKDIQHFVSGVKDIILRTISLKNEKGELVYSRFRQCIHRGIFQYFLEDFNKFDVDDHVYAHEGPVLKSQEEMETLLSTLSFEDMSFDKPPWHLIIIPKTYEGNEAILFLRAHHGLGDGVSFTKFCLEQFPDKPLTNNQPVKFSSVHRKRMLLKALVSGARVLLGKLFSYPDSSIIHGRQLKGEKKMAWSKPLNLLTVKKIKNFTGTTVNDVLMACISMSFHDYFKSHGVANPPDVKVFVPVDVRSKGDPLKIENNFSVVTMKLPASKEDALESLYATKVSMDYIKSSGEAFVMALGANTAVEYMPEFITNLWNMPISNKHSCVLSNVPGAQQLFSVAGHEVKQVFFVPPQRDLVGIGIGIYSYAHEFSIAVSGDVNVMTDPRWIVKAFESRLAQLEKCVVDAK